MNWPDKITYFHSKEGYPQNCVEAANKTHAELSKKTIEILEGMRIHPNMKFVEVKGINNDLEVLIKEIRSRL